MGRFIAALAGVVAGFVLAHVVNQTPEGRAFFSRLGATIHSFVEGFRQSYRA
ncbi:unannotated protein [freshwater metagenome]|uniref:Unannotated protein n=1 Tax=freshwater metagenome TaxID=449393 RepID=A0A6J6EE03_9ZZZZ